MCVYLGYKSVPCGEGNKGMQHISENVTNK